MTRTAAAAHPARKVVAKVRCAIYTRKSSEEGLEMEFNSLDAQREACAAYVVSQKAEGWIAVPDRYDDGGISGGTLERPALKWLIADIELGEYFLGGAELPGAGNIAFDQVFRHVGFLVGWGATGAPEEKGAGRRSGRHPTRKTHSLIITVFSSV